MHYWRKLHYQFTGSINLRIIANINNLSDTVEALDVSFRESDRVYNFASAAIFPEQAETDILKIRCIGNDICKNFMDKTRLEENH